MSLRTLPEARALQRPAAYQADAPSDAVERWVPARAATSDDATVISIFDQIGYDYWTGEGTTTKRIAAILRGVAGKPVTVQMNSPGGDVFEGLAIYNLLREHQGEVTVKVLGLAASAASVIAMAGDKIVMGLGAQMMVHRSWGMVVGNAEDMLAAADVFDGFDASMTEIYAARTGLAEAKIRGYLDGPQKSSDGTWFTAREAVDAGFADSVDDGLDALAAAALPPAIAAKRQLERIAAKAGVSRSEVRHLINDAAERDAGRAGMPGAALSSETEAAIRALIDTMKN